MSRAEQVRSQLLNRKRLVKVTQDQFLSTGSTLLNLACSGRPDGGFLKGHYYFECGDSSSGKTFLGLTCLAEATINPVFDDYRLIYDAPEGGALMNLERFFGPRLVGRLEAPKVEDGEPIYSQTVQDLYYNLDDALKSSKPFIYVLDSQDCLDSEESEKKFQKQKNATKRESVAGSYGDSKAKVHSSNLRRVMGPLQETGSILIILNQTRDSFDLFSPGTYSGGRALLFYATLQLWSSVGGQLKRMVKSKERQVGILSKVRVKKNRTTGKDRTVIIPIYHSCGIDDVGSMVNYLISEKRWKKSESGMVTVTGLGPEFSLKEEPLVQRIQEDGLEDDVREIVKETWDDIEASCAVERKNRYA